MLPVSLGIPIHLPKAVSFLTLQCMKFVQNTPTVGSHPQTLISFSLPCFISFPRSRHHHAAAGLAVADARLGRCSAPPLVLRPRTTTPLLCATVVAATRRCFSAPWTALLTRHCSVAPCCCQCCDVRPLLCDARRRCSVVPSEKKVMTGGEGSTFEIVVSTLDDANSTFSVYIFNIVCSKC